MSDRMPPRTAQALVDLDRNLEHVANLVAKGRDEFNVNELYQWAAQGLAIRIGQDVAALSEDWRAKRPEVPWHKMRGLRNRFAHDYHEIDLEIVWMVFAVELPTVRRALRVDVEAARAILGQAGGT